MDLVEACQPTIVFGPPGAANCIDPATERAILPGTVGEAAAVEFSAFLKVWRELPHPQLRHRPTVYEGAANVHADRVATSGNTHNLLIYWLFLGFNELSHQRVLTAGRGRRS